MDIIVSALAGLRVGRLRELADSSGFAGECKRIVKSVVKAISDRWSGRLSVHVWDRLGLSSRRMDVLRHLLSFMYDPLADTYNGIAVWTNLHDSADVVHMPSIVGRPGREACFAALAAEGEIIVGDDGRCERDAGKCAGHLYSRFARAMRKDYSRSWPARPIFFFNGTGGSLGRGICHAELGSVDFIGDCTQSRGTLDPLAMNQGNDHALPLRAKMQLAMGSFSRLRDEGEIKLDNGECIPCEPIVVGDMQGVKAI